MPSRLLGLSPYYKLNGGGTSPIPQQYYLRQILEDIEANTPERSDGSSLVEFEGALYKMFGWIGPVDGPTDHIYKSIDGGRTWTAEADAPFVSSEQKIALRADGNLWIWDTPDQSVWTYNSIDGFVEIATGGPVVLGACKVLFNDKMLMFCAQSSMGPGPVLDRNVYQFNDSTLVWDIIGETPIDHWACLGTAWVSNGYIYCTGGGKINDSAGVYEFLNDQIIRSSDGITWEIYATLPVDMQSMWPVAEAFDNKVFYINGFADGVNQQGLFYSTNNGLSWISFYTAYSYFSEISPRHATSLGIHDNALYIGWGNFVNDLFRIEPINYPEQSFIDNTIKVYWERLWPDERLSDIKLTAFNNFVDLCLSDTSLNPAVTSNYDECDVVSILAGLNNISQAFMKLKTSNATFDNQSYNLSGSITFSSDGLTGDGISGPIGPSGPALVGLNWNIDNDGEKFSTQNGSIFIYIVAGVFSQYSVIGDSGTTLTNYIVSRENGSNRVYGALNRGDTSVVGPTTAKGYRGLTRSDSSNLEIIWSEPGDSNTHDILSSTAGAYQSTEWTVCGNSNNTNAGSSGETIGLFGFGSEYLDHDKMKDAIEAYLDEVGVIV